ncbi:MAG: glycoside hydrolase family 32 protein, partial [Fibrella sp.]|nr:glycoside hydrolase family 32 protein [Armatimonadota bacterium]
APSRVQGDPDFGGVWTGCITRRPSDGMYVALYTAIPTYEPFTQVQCAALSNDLMTWEKVAENPLTGLSEKPEGYGDCFRDPQTFFGPDGKWYCVIGGEQKNGKGGAAFLYEATDDTFLHWQYRHVLYEGDAETGHYFECPDFFRFPGSNKWCLLTSRGKSWWHVGTLDVETMRFTREAWGECDNELFYAAKSCGSAGSGRVLWGWIREDRPEPEQIRAGWSGVLSLPRNLYLSGDNKLSFSNPSYGLDSTTLPDFLPRFLVGKDTEYLFPGEFQNVRKVEVRFHTGAKAHKRGMTIQWQGGESITVQMGRGRGRGPSSIGIQIDGSLVEVAAMQTYRLYLADPYSFTITIFSYGAESKAEVLTWV